MNQLFLGVDGGGSGTRCRLVDAFGTRLGEGKAGPANLRNGIAAAWAAVRDAAAAAFAEAGLPVERFAATRVGLGMAGACLGPETEAFRGHPHPFAAIRVASDAHVACLGAHGGAAGAIVIVGTGSVAYVWDGSSGRQIGGWGFPVSDGGSGAWIGLEAVRRSLVSLELTPPPPPFAAAILDRFGCDPEAIARWSGTAKAGDYAALVPAVLDAAAAGDAAAERLLREAAAALDGLLAAAARAAGPWPLCLLGGLAAPLGQRLHRQMVARLAEASGDALDGALALAGSPRLTPPRHG